MNNSSDSIVGKEGNTKPLFPKKQDGASKKWCFTLNNYSVEEKNSISKLCLDNIGIIGDEVGDEGTPHLQGYIKFNKAIRLTALKKINNRIHWEKSKGTDKENFLYCSKDNNFIQNIYDDDVLTCPKHEIFNKLLEVIEKPVNKRHIHVIVDYKGGMGKTSFTKFLFFNKKGVYPLSGKGADMKCAIKLLREKFGDPKVVIVDCPRVSNDFISWQGIEEIKNGLIFSGKYEPDIVAFKSPHVIVMMNELPPLHVLSPDRWVIYEVKEEEKEEEEKIDF
jgi:hypothetical protein